MKGKDAAGRHLPSENNLWEMRAARHNESVFLSKSFIELGFVDGL